MRMIRELAFIAVAVIAAAPPSPACPPAPGPLEPDRGWVMDVLEGPCDLTIVGAEKRARLGSLLLTADVNADGLADIVTHAFRGEPSGRTTRDILVFFGPRVMPRVQDLAIEPADLVVSGDATHFPEAVALGDLTGDGLADLVLTMGDGITCTRDTVVLQGPLPAGLLDAATLAPWARLYTARPCSPGTGGIFNGLVGDVTADGWPDLVLANDGFQHPGWRWAAGELRIIPGPLAAGALIDVDTDPSVAIVLGEPTWPGDSGTFLGRSLAAGDVTGDGVSDLMAGAPGQRDPADTRRHAGIAHVLAGPIATGSVRDLATTPAEVRIVGPHDSAMAGWWIEVGDLTGDGRSDLVVSAPHEAAMTGEPDAGAVHVLEAPLAPGVIDLAVSPSFAVIHGAAPEPGSLLTGDWMGYSFALGDVDGNSRTDLVASATLSSGPTGTRPEAGRIAVLRGPLARGLSFDFACDRPDIDMRGARNGDGLGERTVVADLTGDGAGEVVVVACCASGALGDRTGAGEIYAVDGTNRLPIAAHGGPYAAECTGPTTTIALDASASVDPDGDPLRFFWATDCPHATFDDASSPVALVTLMPDAPACETTCRVAVTATDCLGAYERVVTTVTVRDTLAPEIEPASDVVTLWPPNHRARWIPLSAFHPIVRDACGNPAEWRFAGCESNEPEDGRGDGATVDDCIVADDGKALLVRPERSGTGYGRNYAVRITATDACGNVSAPVGAGSIIVPHDGRGPRAMRAH